MKRASLLLALFLVACGGGPPVQSDFNPTVDFSTYRSFSFDASNIAAAEGSVGHDPRILETIRKTIVDDLGADGMASLEEGGALSISISLAVSEETAVDQWGTNWYQNEAYTPGGQSFQHKEGTLVIDFFDAATNQLVWRSWAHSGVTRTGDPDLDLLAKLVLAMLAEYPPAPAEE